jgi:signal transduction histidine kinase
MHDFELYRQQLFTFNNPLFFAIILSFVVIIILIFLYVQVLFPLQKKMIEDKNKHLLEKAELMALFAEMDPNPLLRINSRGEIIQSNEASRKLFLNKDLNQVTIHELMPGLMNNYFTIGDKSIFEIENKIFSVIIQREEKLDFINIYLHDITTQKKYEAELEKYKVNLTSLSSSLDKQIEELKKDLSSELHDDICQRMILAKMKLSQPNKYKTPEIENDLEEITEQVREISHTLAPVNVNAFGVEFTLRNLVNKVSENSGIKGIMEFVGELEEIEDELDENVKSVLIRCVQEALTNIVKHSKANKFFVRLILNHDSVELIIADNGVGINKQIDDLIIEGNSGIGLFRLRERVKGVGGSLKVASNKKYKTNLIVNIPVNIWCEKSE